MIRRFLIPLLLLSCLAVVPAAPADEPGDPLEGFNRAVFAFNEDVDLHILKPLTRAYLTLPIPMRNGIGNFFGNLYQPAVAVNSLLQGKPGESGRAASRFAINTTVGFLGLLDAAREMGLEPVAEDFGQTLAVWGVGEGPYIVWPLIGPRSLRDTLGWVLDRLGFPPSYLQEGAAFWSAYGVEVVDARARLIPSDEVLTSAAGDDRYLFMREAYRQRRQYQIHDGNPPREAFEEEPPANGNAPPPPVVVPLPRNGPPRGP